MCELLGRSLGKVIGEKFWVWQSSDTISLWTQASLL